MRMLKRLLGPMAVVLLAACSNNVPPPDMAVQQELKQLRAENQEVAKLRRENQELPRLRKDNDEVQKLRSIPTELAALRTENEQLKQAPPGRGQGANAPIDPATGRPVPLGGSVVAGGEQAQATNQLAVVSPDEPQEGDEIFVDPKMLGRLLPGFDWEKLERKEPVAIKSLLEQQGIVLTNYQQLISFGITNYTIQRNPPKPGVEPQ